SRHDGVVVPGVRIRNGNAMATIDTGALRKINRGSAGRYDKNVGLAVPVKIAEHDLVAGPVGDRRGFDSIGFFAKELLKALPAAVELEQSRAAAAVEIARRETPSAHRRNSKIRVSIENAGAVAEIRQERGV